MSKIRAKSVIKTVTDDGMRLDYSFVAGTPVHEVLKTLDMDIRKTYTEAEHEKILQEKLRQQRDACADAYIEHDEGYAHVVEAIMDATIDNNGEEG